MKRHLHLKVKFRLLLVIVSLIYCSDSFSQFNPERKQLKNGKPFSRTSVIAHDKENLPYYNMVFYFQDSIGAYQEIYCQENPGYSMGLGLHYPLPDSIYGDYDTLTYKAGTWAKKGDSKKTVRQRKSGKYQGADSIYTRVARRPIEAKLSSYKDYLIQNNLIDTFYVENSEVYPRSIDPWNKRDSIECQYYKGNKHGIEIGYYSNKEIKETCSKPPFIKYQGEWNNNVKHGKWIYYSPLGEIIGTEKYKFGRLVKKST